MPAAMKKRVRAKVQLLDESAAGDGIGQPLHVRISGSTADLLLCDPSSDDGTLALVSPENVALMFPGLFVNYTIVDDGKAPVAAAEHLSSGGCVKLIVTQEFQRRHPRWVHNEAVVDVLCGVRCPRLAKVSLLARSADAYEKLNGPSLWEALGGGERAERSAGGILCRMDDSLATFEGDSVLVVDCEPTRQGLIVPETQVVCIRSSLEHSPAGESAASRDDVAKLAGTILYTSRILHSSHRSKRDSLAAVAAGAISRRQPSDLLRVHILPQLPEDHIPSMADPLSCVFLAKSMMAAMHLDEGSWAKAWLHDSGTEAPEQRLTRQVVVYSLDKLQIVESEMPSGGAVAEDVAYMGPHLWFHLHDRQRPVLLVRPTARLRLEVPSGPKSAAPPEAQEFTLAIIRSPAYSSTIECTDLLKAHFSRPRYICKGDIVTVDLHSSPCPEQYLPDGSSRRNHVVFFKVTQLLGPAAGCFCSVNTRLYQVMCCCYIPPSTRTEGCTGSECFTAPACFDVCVRRNHKLEENLHVTCACVLRF